jgi:hypothetical protein
VIEINRARQPVGPRVTLYAETFTLPPDRFAKILELRLDDVCHGFARSMDGVADLLTHRVDRHTIP